MEQERLVGHHSVTVVPPKQQQHMMHTHTNAEPPQKSEPFTVKWLCLKDGR